MCLTSWMINRIKSAMLDRSSKIVEADQPPELTADLLSEMLMGMRLRGLRYGRCVLSPPFAVAFPNQAEARFHFIGKGGAILRVGGEDHLLGAGDAVLLPRGTAHELRSDQERPCVCETSLAETRICSEVSVLRNTADPAPAPPGATVVFCGSMQFELDTLRPLVALMPEAMPARALSCAQPELPPILEAMAREVSLERAGAAGLLARLADVVAVSIVRAWIETDCARQAEGWMAALRDPRLGRVISAIHGDPGRDWTVSELAKVMGASRSAFAARFQQVTGETPLRYVTEVRIRRAALLLEQERLSVEEVAARLGYGSHTAFGRAFKRVTGHAPRARPT